MQDNANPIRVVMVTGPSGAGRSSAINVLEDLGFEAIDNLPMSLIPRLLDGPPLPRPLALGVDVRNRDFSSESLIELVDRLHRLPNVAAELLYLDCDTDTLVRRYSETRRRHPLSPDDAPLIGIEYELALLEPVRARADALIETSGLTPHQLRAEVTRWFAPRDGRPMALSIQSFSYKRGLPRGVDMVFDVRFLTNPHWVPELREHDGRTPQVAAHVEADPRFSDFFTRVHDLIASLLEAYVDEGKASLTIAFGCSGGKHRSVAVAEKMARVLADQGWRVSKRHRELERRKLMAASEKQG
ncbi:RNase adapter RapZ [Rhodobacter sp. NTK016B]|uniref:RNase adapter RapZ n=1 Tax=Rhodobacter sp. NTK016B TaxID=2759676 RepID=UPI001A8E3B17|nr:RNase adapter RapZ [Rhodobacter sp. NTK016B]MBN8292760.1 RNase adapter RapZ [Rhodobacter sp. NTK016B]